ncbi:MAG: DUF935 domain-containing protein [Pseudomonadota bacterium]
MARTPTLLDSFGRPVRRQSLTEQQARPSIASIRQPWGESVALGLDPARLAGILRQSGEGDARQYVILAEEMEERDPHYASVLGTRKRAVSGIAPIVHAGGNDAQAERIADAVRAAIAEHDGLPGLIEDLMDAVAKGWAAVEIHWQRSASEWQPAHFAWADPRWFKWDRNTGRELLLLTDAKPAEGEALEPYHWITHCPRNKSGLAIRGGLARLVAFSWLCKAYALKDWVAFAELYGLPIRIGRYGPEATEGDIRALLRMVGSIGTDGAAVVPEHMNVEFAEVVSRAEGGALFENLARWIDEQVSKAVLGQTMTADSGSSRAQAEVHDQVRHDILVSDARQLTATLNRDLVQPFVDLNFGPQSSYPRLELPVTDPEDVAALMDAVVKAASIGVRFRAAEIRAKLGMAAPDPDDPPEEIVGGVPAPAPAVALNRQQPGLALAREERRDVYAPLEDIEARAALEFEPELAPLIEPILAMVAEAETFEEILERLPELGANPELTTLVEGIVQAMFMARVEGDIA